MLGDRHGHFPGDEIMMLNRVVPVKYGTTFTNLQQTLRSILAARAGRLSRSEMAPAIGEGRATCGFTTTGTGGWRRAAGRCVA